MSWGDNWLGKKGSEKLDPKLTDKNGKAETDPDCDLSEIEEELISPEELKAKLEKEKAEQFQRDLEDI
jgi:hypothetical protein